MIYNIAFLSFFISFPFLWYNLPPFFCFFLFFTFLLFKILPFSGVDNHYSLGMRSSRLVAYSHEALILRRREGKERKSIVWWRGIGMVERKKGIHFLPCPIIFFLFFFFVIMIGGEEIWTLILLIRGTNHCH